MKKHNLQTLLEEAGFSAHFHTGIERRITCWKNEDGLCITSGDGDEVTLADFVRLVANANLDRIFNIGKLEKPEPQTVENLLKWQKEGRERAAKSTTLYGSTEPGYSVAGSGGRVGMVVPGTGK